MPKQTPKDIEYPQSGLLLLLAAQQINYPKLSLSFELFHFFFFGLYFYQLSVRLKLQSLNRFYRNVLQIVLSRCH